MPIYLDYHATTPVDPRVFAAMTPYFMEVFGNPASTSHRVGLQAQAAVEQARQRIADRAQCVVAARDRLHVRAPPNPTTSPSRAWRARAASRGRHVVTAATEHKCVLNACKALRDDGYDVTFLPVAS